MSIVGIVDSPWRYPVKSVRGEELSEAVVADPAGLAVDVETPSGDALAIDDPALVRELNKRPGGGQTLTFLRSERALTDCRPVSLFSVQTAQQLSDELDRIRRDQRGVAGGAASVTSLCDARYEDGQTKI